MGTLRVDGLGFEGRSILSLCIQLCVCIGSPLLCARGLLLGKPQGKPVVDNLERRRQLAGLGTVVGGQAELA